MKTAALALALAACSAHYPAQLVAPDALPPGPAPRPFVMDDGARLPTREWLPATPPATPPAIVLLALHGFNDSADAWELPAPALAAAGIAVIAADQRGFGAAPERGQWPGTARLTADAAAMATQLHARFPHARLYLMGESMGGAVLMQLATLPTAPRVDGYILISPAVWGWSQMNLLLRAPLWLANRLTPGLSLSPGPIRVRASDNNEALRRLSTDPRTLTRTRVAAIKGLVDLMSAAQAAAPHLSAPTLVLYGGHDQLIPPRAAAAAWRAMSANPRTRLAYYPNAYHLLLRDLSRAVPLTDLIAWLHAPRAPLPSHADHAARAWLATLPPPPTTR